MSSGMCDNHVPAVGDGKNHAAANLRYYGNDYCDVC